MDEENQKEEKKTSETIQFIKYVNIIHSNRHTNTLEHTPHTHTHPYCDYGILNICYVVLYNAQMYKMCIET